ncbi:FAD-binding oxidoreductase [Pseudomonas sp. LS1212]|uniref:NAD(P)/FAD-dependent oxidoreductase n=1 Tax=Pseudomonas sp. LS1212 TaxID=2972478 RepID=UPI00215BDB82|nr:FAD-binding oxidoreductase [Pseudomonas sp. LS1212]UVJ44327.1 FAD-binding oxidoreductase [Pseudomonas sp. LS1212]
MFSSLTAPATYYFATRNRSLDCPPLEGQAQADVCVVGGGFTGVNTAIELAERGHSVILLEARQIAWAASGRNGGQLIRGLGHDLGKFQKYIGSDGCQTLERLGLEAVDIVRQRVQRHAIDCDLRWGHCELANTPAHYAGLIREREALERQGYAHEVSLVEPHDMARVVASDCYVGGLIDNGSGHLHPLNLALGEAAVAQGLGVRICENSMVTRIEYGSRVRVHTAKGQVLANTLVLAGNAHLGNLEPALSGKVLPAGSYVIATEPLDAALAETLIPANRALCDQRVGLDYYRLSADRRLLFGGACRYSGRDPSDVARYMRPKMLKVFPQLADKRIDFQWSGMIGIGANRLPQIGRLQAQPNVYYAQAYAGHGLNTTHLAARLLAEAISREHSHGFDLFARVPHMTFPGGQRLRSPLLALGMLWYRLKDAVGA